jgi:DNA repair protein RecO (recombination protein O)
MTDIQKTDGIVIRKTRFGNTSEIVTFYTRHFGKVRATAKGISRRKNPFEGHLELFSLNEMVFIEGRREKLATLTESSLVSAFAGLRESTRKLYGACFLAEFIDQMVEEYDPNPELFNLFLKSIIDLSRNNDILLYRIFFTAKSLRLLGVMGTITHCCNCARKFSPGEETEIQADGEGLLCPECTVSGDPARAFSASSRATLDRILSWERKKLKRLHLSKTNAAETWQLMKVIIGSTTKKELRTFRYVENR